MFFFFFNDTATTEIYTLSLHDALPILASGKFWAETISGRHGNRRRAERSITGQYMAAWVRTRVRSEEHTSELQSRQYLVCRLLLEKKKKRPLLFSVSSVLRQKTISRHC